MSIWSISPISSIRDAAVGLCNHPQLWFGNPPVGQIPPRPLVDRIMDGAQERVGYLPRVPPEGGTVHFNKRRVFVESGIRQFFGHFQNQPGHGGLSYPRRAV